LHLNLPAWVGPAALAGLAVAALTRGGLEERLATGGLIANVVLTRFLRDYSWPHVQWTAFALDILFLALLFGIALRSARYWPLAATAFQLLAVITHIAMMVDRTVHPWAYISAIVIWTYLLITTLSVAVWNSWRTKRYSENTGLLAPAFDTRR
jgi:hypothetical protein